jgi:hypothetical protein
MVLSPGIRRADRRRNFQAQLSTPRTGPVKDHPWKRFHFAAIATNMRAHAAGGGRIAWP